MRRHTSAGSIANARIDDDSRRVRSGAARPDRSQDAPKSAPRDADHDAPQDAIVCSRVVAGDAGAIDLRIAGTVDETFLSALKALRYDQAAPLTGSPAWLTAWVTQVMRPCGRDGLFISGHDAAGRPVLALALEIVQRLGGRVAVSLGADAFANHAIALDPTLAAALDADAAEALLVEIMRASRQIDAILLRNVPGDVAGRENPFLGTRAIRAPNDNFERSIGPDYAALYTATFSSRERRNHARQRRRLDELGDGAARLILTSGSDATHAARTLDTFYAFKAQQLAEIGAPDPFADVQLRAFYADALARAEDAAEQTPLFALLEVAGAPAAVLIGVHERGRFTTLMSAIGSGPVMRTGPGEVLLQAVMQTLCARGVTVFDFGPGESAQKLRWELKPYALYDRALVLRARAWPAVAMALSATWLRRRAKAKRGTYALLFRARAFLFGRRR